MYELNVEIMWISIFMINLKIVYLFDVYSEGFFRLVFRIRFNFDFGMCVLEKGFKNGFIFNVVVFYLL